MTRANRIARLEQAGNRADAARLRRMSDAELDALACTLNPTTRATVAAMSDAELLALVGGPA